MFRKIKQIFSKKKKKPTKYKTTQEVTFRDIAGREIILEIKINGNATLLSIHDEDKVVEFMFDQDTATLFDALIQYYAMYGIFPDLTDEK